MIEAISETRRLKAMGELSGHVNDWSFLYDQIFKRSGIPQGQILDLGSADGRLDAWFRAQQIDRKVISFDIRNFGRLRNFVRGTARALPFKDNSFDTIVSIGALPLHAIGNEALIMNEMISVARERLVIWPSMISVRDWLGAFNTIDAQEIDLFKNDTEESDLLELTGSNPQLAILASMCRILTVQT